MSVVEREARRTAFILASTQAIVGSAASICMSIGGLAGHFLLAADKSLATAPVTGFNIGVAVAALPAAALIRCAGARGGFMFGTLVTALGGALATFALFQDAFWLFAAGLVIVGCGGAFVQQLRFAAADRAPSAFKANAISMVLAGGVVTAILGPQIVIFTRDLFAPLPFAGAFAAIIVLAAAGAFVLSFLREGHGGEHAMVADQVPPRPLGAIVLRLRFMVGLLCGVGSFALMSLVMTGAPLAMIGCGFTIDEATLGISWHVMAMYAPSFLTGYLIRRFGVETIVATGLLLLLACAVVALSGIALWQFWTSLILLGCGWNLAFVGSTAMVAATYRPAEKAKVQGLHDSILFGSVAFSSLMAGVVYNAWGWNALNIIVFPVALLCLAGLAVLMFRGSPARN